MLLKKFLTQLSERYALSLKRAFEQLKMAPHVVPILNVLHKVNSTLSSSRHDEDCYHQLDCKGVIGYTNKIEAH